jgi:hypothetical protein
MKGFYVDLKRGAKFALLAGPFPDEATARKYEAPAVKLAQELDPWASFDPFGVMSIDTATDKLPIGKLNDRLDIEPADLLQLEEA